jgi:SAM-dependent methyltransferase
MMTGTTDPVDGFEAILTGGPARAGAAVSPGARRGHAADLRRRAHDLLAHNRTGDPGGADSGDRHWLVDADGRCVSLPVDRWHGPPEPAVRELIDRCTGPTVDIGCGPGRITAALAGRGLVSLGIDTSPTAVRLTRRRGAAALRRDVFDPLPGEGRWAHLLLADGNIGIGGDPTVLLRRCAELLRPGGTALVELDPPGSGLWRGRAHVAYGERDRPIHRGPTFRWARLGVETVERLAVDAGLLMRATLYRDERWFAELVRP